MGYGRGQGRGRGASGATYDVSNWLELIEQLRWTFETLMRQ